MKSETVASTAFFLGRLLKPFVAVGAPFFVLLKTFQDFAESTNKGMSLTTNRRTHEHNEDFMDFLVASLPYHIFYALDRLRERNQK